MKPVLLIGAGKFALEIAHYLEDCVRASAFKLELAGYVPLAGDAIAAPQASIREGPWESLWNGEAALVLASSDPDQRAGFLDDLDPIQRDRFITFVHPSATGDGIPQHARGTIIGPHCHVGVNTRIGDFCVLNYLLSIGHHSEIGEGNFFSPGFHCGNSVSIGRRNFFGLGCVVGPGVQVGHANRIQAGSLILETIGNAMVCVPTQRTKFIPSEGA
ncbi:hypothetical protein LPU83_pLPU83b_0015 (plasmid) [Rhizobium favelukesii]|uniref:Acetyltransferase n=1 Tax=Rhizobium favelukesii TaxID=348824 RepID=W6RI26_9HYPH|nr:hypothetical protein LPU83_pLPU83b_0015 [Rhizobium favelukesii]